MPLPFTARSLDPDAAAFCARSGASDVAAIDAFVKGVKDLGLWDKMVCWPLRRQQNSGTDTAYSLGGLGMYDGSLINGPAWTADGLVTDATNENVQLPDAAALYNARSGMVAFKTTDTGLNRQLIEFQSGASAAEWYYLFRFTGTPGAGAAGIRIAQTRNGTASANDNQSRTIDLVNFQTGAFTMDDSTDNVFRNGNLEVAGARTGLSAINPTGARSIRLMFGNSTDMTGAFAMTSTAKWTDSQVTALHNLYRATLGANLGLPDYDPATIEYAARSGATDLANIDAFVRGVKDLGLWESMVCWPLRSTQNAGTGDTVYSLGGLGTYDGTRVNAPAWGADGITFANASLQYITTTFTANLSTADTLIGSIAKLTDTGIRYLVALGTTGASRGFELTQGGATSLTCQAFGSIAFAPIINHSATRGSWESYAALNSNSGTTATVIFGASSNASTEAAHVVTSATHTFVIGQNIPSTSGDRYMEGDQAFAYALRGAAATLANYLALRTLYKQTLGTGLGLP